MRLLPIVWPSTLVCTKRGPALGRPHDSPFSTRQEVCVAGLSLSLMEFHRAAPWGSSDEEGRSWGSPWEATNDFLSRQCLLVEPDQASAELVVIQQSHPFAWDQGTALLSAVR